MRYIEVIVDTPAKEIDRRCEEMTAMGVGGFVIENEEDFRNFLEKNHMLSQKQDTIRSIIQLQGKIFSKGR